MAARSSLSRTVIDPVPFLFSNFRTTLAESIMWKLPAELEVVAVCVVEDCVMITRSGPTL